ncbi:MAG TPA: HEAT repeat domain-containing protein [Planctomycetota bacterium]
MPTPEPDANEAAQARKASLWVQQWSRTLKAWRLYGPQNPTLEKFKSELAASLHALLDSHGTLKLRFTADAVLVRDHVVHEARTREDNLGQVFFRDGIHSVSLLPGIGRDELDSFLALIIRATNRASTSDEDLCTLLWDAELEHVDMNYVSAEMWLDLDEEGAAGQGDERAGARPPMAWPEGAAPSAPEPVALALVAPSGPSLPMAAAVPGAPSPPSRSEDWLACDPSQLLDDHVEELIAGSGPELERFRRERESEAALERSSAALSLLDDAHAAGLSAAEGAELRGFVERLLLETIARGDWPAASRAAAALRSDPVADGHAPECLAALTSPGSVVTAAAVQKLDHQGPAEVGAFLELVAALGPVALDWYLAILFESQQQRVRRPLARAIAEVARGQEARLESRLQDPRWYVVRNTLHILRFIGGDVAVPWLHDLLRHTDRRVRMEAIAVLGEAASPAAREVLLDALDAEDPRVQSGALYLLSAGRDPEVAARLLARVRAPEFLQASLDEQRTVLSGLGATGDDRLLPALVELLDPPRKPSRETESLLAGLARCIARLDTPASLAALQAAQGSRWPATREAATLALHAKGAR